MVQRQCRFCGSEIKDTFVDLGVSPLSNSYLSRNQIDMTEKFYPLHAYVCRNCFLVQLPVFESPEHIFEDYSYMSSYSTSWLKHARDYVEMITQKKTLNHNCLVIEIASNDGYLLQYFIEKGIPVLGIEPAKNIAEIANKKGVETIPEFFGEHFAKELIQQGKKADLIVANNVLAHVPDINSFVEGIWLALKEDGTATFEFPGLLNLIQFNQYDTIYHEHFSYLSLSVVNRIFNSHGLMIYDVEELVTHGGSLRVYVCKDGYTGVKISDSVFRMLDMENEAGFNAILTYHHFTDAVIKSKRKLLALLISLKEKNKTIIGYGAPAKGNTLLNYCGIRRDFLDYVVDLSPSKQGKYLPGTHLPILEPDIIKTKKPDYILILPWNLKEEILLQLNYTKEWGCKFIIPIPEVKVI